MSFVFVSVCILTLLYLSHAVIVNEPVHVKLTHRELIVSNAYLHFNNHEAKLNSVDKFGASWVYLNNQNENAYAYGHSDGVTYNMTCKGKLSLENHCTIQKHDFNIDKYRRRDRRLSEKWYFGSGWSFNMQCDESGGSCGDECDYHCPHNNGGHPKGSTTSKNCIFCPRGKQRYSNYCQICVAGKYNDQPKSSADPLEINTDLFSRKCKVCPVGYFQDEEGKGSCHVCSAVQIEGATTCSSNCKAGQYYEGNSCKQCPAGFVQHRSVEISSGDSACYKCEKGYYDYGYQDEIAQAYCKKCKGYVDENNPVECKTCPRGKKFNFNSCVDCVPGTYSNGKHNNYCRSCEKGTFNDEIGSSECKGCAAGTYSSEWGQVQCKPCESGKYGDKDGANECKECPDGQYNDETGTTSCKGCQDVSADKTECLNCEASTCRCLSGTFYDGAVCVDCEAGKYKATQTLVNASVSACEDCPPDSYTDEVGQHACKQCDGFVVGTSCIQCEAGKFMNNGTCEFCQPGTYSALVPHNAKCLVCENNRFSDEIGAIQCKMCPNGQLSTSDAAACVECQKGEYASSTCKPCKGNRYNDATGQTACKTCESPNVPMDFIQSSTGSGLVPTACGTPTAAGGICPVGTFVDGTECTACPAGFVSKVNDAAACEECNALNKLYQNLERQTTCKTCYKGVVSDNDCATCDQGLYFNTTENGCKTCPLGKFHDTDVTALGCKGCPTGWFRQNVSRSSCEMCSDDFKDYGYTNLTSVSQCNIEDTTHPCADGYGKLETIVRNEDGINQVCAKCKRKEYSFEDQCLPCKSGYSSFPGSTQCTIDCTVEHLSVEEHFACFGV